MPQDVTQLPQDVTQLPQDVTQLPHDVTRYKLLCPEAGAPAGGIHFWNPCLLKIQVFVPGSRRPCRGNPFYKLLVASHCSRRGFLLAKKSVPGILEPPIVENASFCVRKQAPLPGESILQAFSGLSVLPQGLFFCQKVRSRLFLVQNRAKL